MPWWMEALDGTFAVAVGKEEDSGFESDLALVDPRASDSLDSTIHTYIFEMKMEIT